MKPEYLLDKANPPVYYNRKKGFIRLTIDLLESEPIHSSVFNAVEDAIHKQGIKIISLSQDRILTCRRCLNQTENNL